MTERRVAADQLSLVVGVFGEARHLPRLLKSLREQPSGFEVVVVDQNETEWLCAVLEAFKDLRLTYVRAPPGLSRARNVGLAVSSGALVGFPDDDCWYPQGLLDRVLERFGRDDSLDGMTCRCLDEAGRTAAGEGDHRTGFVTRRTVWRRGVSATLFVRRRIIERVGAFDPDLGLGAATPFQSGEETDFLLRALSVGGRFEHRADLSVLHPSPPPPSASHATLRAWRYGLGMGRVLRMHKFPILAVSGSVLKPGVGALAALVRGDAPRARMRLGRALGRYTGWRWREGREIHPPRWVATQAIRSP